MSEFSAKRFLISLAVLLVLSLSSLIFIIVKVNPETARFASFLAFYISIFFTMLAGFSLMGYILRTALTSNNPLQHFAAISFRQGALIAVLGVVLLVLQSLRAVSLLSVVLLIFSLTLLEIAMLTRN